MFFAPLKANSDFGTDIKWFRVNFCRNRLAEFGSGLLVSSSDFGDRFFTSHAELNIATGPVGIARMLWVR